MNYKIISCYDQEKGAQIIANALTIDSFRIASGFGIASPSPEQRLIFARGLFRPEHRVFFAVSDNIIVGFFAIDNWDQKNHNCGTHTHIWSFTKYLPQLIELFFDIVVTDFGCDVVHCHIKATNKKAQKVVEHLGFKLCGIVPRYFHGIDSHYYYKTF